MIKNKLYSQLVCVAIYILSFWVSYLLIPDRLIYLESIDEVSFWMLVLIWHLYATIFIYIFSVLLRNSSLYDPFWSLAPVPIVLVLSNGMSSLEIKLLVVIPITLWAIRLTRNWIINTVSANESPVSVLVSQASDRDALLTNERCH